MRLSLVFVSAIAALATTAVAAQGTSVFEAGRYLRVVPEPTPEQQRPMETVVSLAFPRDEVTTIGEATNYLLRRTGYTVPDLDEDEHAVHAKVANFPLPEVHRDFDGVTVIAILEALAGVAYAPVVNHAERTVLFDLRDDRAQDNKRRRQRT